MQAEGRVLSASVDEAFVIEREVSDHPGMWTKYDSREHGDEALDQRDRCARSWPDRKFRVVRVLTTIITQEVG